jgi:hypothetical protein
MREGSLKKSICSNQRAQKKEKKSETRTPSKIKARGESKSKECLEKHKNIPHTCTSRSSWMTSFFLDLVFGSTTSYGISDSHSYPTQSST